MALNRIDACFEKLKQENKKAFVAYVTAGDPSLEKTDELIFALEKSGVDILELGVPFSDPIADGVVIQLAFQRALEAGTTLSGVLDCVGKIRLKSQLPIIIFTYLNPILQLSWENFLTQAVKAGVDGVLVLDLPPDLAEQERKECEKKGIKWITLVAPTTPQDRVPILAKSASGFVYYVSREGVTGMQTQVAGGVAEHVAGIRKATDIPVCVGFGISNEAQVKQVAQMADGVVVGSAIVKKIETFSQQNKDWIKQVSDFVKPLAAAAHEG
ncbi:MAG: tryptophan synthase subunit alpha [Verrucomicrobiae bacterium]|nr:tryptophan synthase subunit alpha [Verrucomicrobiae bacterium]